MVLTYEEQLFLRSSANKCMNDSHLNCFTAIFYKLNLHSNTKFRELPHTALNILSSKTWTFALVTNQIFISNSYVNWDTWARDIL